MKPWLSEQGVFGGGDKDATMQETSTDQTHKQDVVKESPQGDVIATGKEESSKT